MTEKRNGLKYIGKGHWIPDIPARDLTPSEVEKCGGKKFLITTGLYDEFPKRTKKKVEIASDEASSQ